MSHRVVVTARARADAVEAFRWKAERSARSAERWLVGLEKAIARLGKFPGRHPIAEDESSQLGVALREMIYGKKPGIYRILFTLEDDLVVVQSIRHASRSSADEED